MKHTTQHSIIFIIFLVVFSNTYAQKEATWWYFGHNAGLNFNKTTIQQSAEGVMVNNVPTAVKGPIDTPEGSFSISDKDGNFIMASNGVIVYNKNKVVMENGRNLNGGTDASQSGIVIPRPLHSNEYYIVTVDQAGGTRGIHYSIADLNANAGLGKITTKNVPLGYGGATITSNNAGGMGQVINNSISYENISSVAHRNGINFWLIQRTRDKFFTWLVTENGIDPKPIISEIGRDNGDDSSPRGVKLGYIKFSPDGKLVAQAGGGSGWVTVGDFNALTGIVTNIRERLIPNVENMYTPLYGIEFSPSGKYLYVAQLDYGPTRCLPTDDIANGKMISFINMPCTTLQLGPDGRIYGISYLKNNASIWIMENPDLADGIVHQINNVLKSRAILGLPSFITSYFNINVNGDNIFCFDTQKSFNINIKLNGALVKVPKYTVWDFGDGTNLTAFDDTNVPGTQSKAHTYHRPGNYKITVKIYDENKNEIPEMMQTFDVNVKPCVLPVNPNKHNNTN